MMTSTEIAATVRAGMDLAILPVGATEQHGPHLATGTDSVSPEALAWRVSAATGAVVLPTLSYGLSLGHTSRWPGTLSLHPQTMTQVVVEIGRWVVASGFRRLIMLSGNGPNQPPLDSARLQLRHEFPRCRFRVLTMFFVSPRVQKRYSADADDFHANDGETSLLMHLRPEMVRPARAVDEEDVTPGLVWSYDMPATTRSGVVGRPRGSSARAGKALLDMLVEDTTDFVRKALAEKWPAVPGPLKPARPKPRRKSRGKVR
ncbi:MAG: creatininase family protein [Alphaproteobacteria bacterium]|nr:creatininase family protein [Alphaproteobacteria bacterium]